jgi:hypothetical protein
MGNGIREQGEVVCRVKKFVVATEDRGFQFDVTVEAESIEEAVKIVREQHCKPRMVEVTPHPTWAEPLPEGQELDELFEFTWELGPQCDDCGRQMFHQRGTKTGNHETDSWPWTYASGDEGCYTDICWPCAQKRKEAGNYCAYMNNYYRVDYRCGECPESGCRHVKSEKAETDA